MNKSGLDLELDEAGDPRAALLPLVRLLARQAAREDYARALEAAPSKPYSKERDRPNVVEET
ncbi:MAG: hypothetical protein NW206_18180 [Hyphomonadaceae bacterium]|nr:hypothetical protein [Hyphomonadaceae bacterium]